MESKNRLSIHKFFEKLGRIYAKHAFVNEFRHDLG